MLPLLLGLGGLTALAWKRAKASKVQAMTPQLEFAFQRLLDAKLPAEKYAKAADIFADAGLSSEADLLRKRGKLAALPDSEKAKLTDAMTQAMASQNPEGIRGVADVLHGIGAVGAASKLREHADAVQTAATIADVHAMTDAHPAAAESAPSASPPPNGAPAPKVESLAVPVPAPPPNP